MEQKLSSSGDKKNHSGKDIVDKIEDRSGNSSATIGNNVSDSSQWKEQRTKSFQKPKEIFQLSLFNRFSFWEEENEDESEVDKGSTDLNQSIAENGSDELTCSPKVEGRRTL